MILQAIVTVQWSDISDLGEDICVEDSELSITPLHANLNHNLACFEDVSDQYTEMLKDLIDECKLEIDPDTLYHTIFKVTLTYHTDYWGEVDTDYTLELINHEAIGKFDEDNNLVYSNEKHQKSVECDILKLLHNLR